MATEIYELEMSAPGKNSLSSTHMQELIARLREAGGKPLLLTGSAGAFSAGLNLKEVASLDRAGMERFLLLLDDLIDALFLYPGPTAAAVNGHAIAGGCVLVLCCDLRVATSDPAVRIGLNEVPLGLEFPPKILALARHRVPRHALERVVLAGGLHDPAQALALGLVDEVAADPRTAARAGLAAFAVSAPEVYAKTKRSLRAGVLDLSDAERRYFQGEVIPLWCSDAVRSSVQARLAPKGA